MTRLVVGLAVVMVVPVGRFALLDNAGSGAASAATAQSGVTAPARSSAVPKEGTGGGADVSGRVQHIDLSQFGLGEVTIHHVLKKLPTLQLRVQPRMVAPGATTRLSVKLHNRRFSMPGVQADISFDSANVTIAAASDGTPDCTALSSSASPYVGFRPSGCSGTACTGIRAVVLSSPLGSPLPGGHLFSCRVVVNPAAAAGTFNLTLSQVRGTSAQGFEVPFSNLDGFVVVRPQ